MPSPFPGMDPFLEHPALWPGVHNRLIAALDDDLSGRLPAGYFVSVEERVYVVDDDPAPFVGRPDLAVGLPANGRPDAPISPIAQAGRELPAGVLVLEAEVPVPDTVRETYLDVRETATGEVVTTIEVLSPTNKRPGVGRSEYQAKRLRTLGTFTHLVEIDLLRGGEPLPMRLRGEASDGLPGDYRILVAEAERRPVARLYAFGLRDRIPPFAIPLRRPEESLTVDLQALLTLVYDRARYSQRIDYRTDPVPPLNPQDADWADRLLRERGLR